MCICVVLTLLCITCVSSDTIDPKKIVLMDYNRQLNNFLFRGNEPKTTNSSGDFFAYDLLYDYLNALASSHGLIFPAKYYFIDLKLYYFENISRDMSLERDFFIANPNLGKFAPQQILGDISSPNIVPGPIMESLARSLDGWQKDKLTRLIPYINQLLNSPGPQSLPVIIYVHCECGCDRTGEVSGSYAMKFLGWTFQAALKWDESIAGRFILPNHKFAMEWYCEYLRFVEGKSVGPCDD